MQSQHEMQIKTVSVSASNPCAGMLDVMIEGDTLAWEHNNQTVIATIEENRVAVEIGHSTYAIRLAVTRRGWYSLRYGEFSKSCQDLHAGIVQLVYLVGLL